MIRRGSSLLGILLCLASAGVAAAQGAFALKSGDRVVFYGDSITEQALYTTFAETYVITRFPSLKVDFVESGWGGDRVTGGGGGPIDVRLKRDAIAYKPTVMTVMLGMNDGGYRAFDPGLFHTYTTGYESIVDTMLQAVPGLRMTLIQPSPYDDVTRPPNFEGGYNAVLIRYGEFVKDLAQRKGQTTADLNSPVVACLHQAQATDPTLAQKIIPDRVHPGPGGHLIMAEALLKAWNAPSVVTAVEIDAAGKRVARAEHTRVSDLNAGESLSWEQRDDALPMPVDLKDPVVALAIHSSDFVDALDEEPLRVTGLTATQYQLQIDGQTVGSFTKEQLAEGINLAPLPTPMAAQAAEVEALTREHNGLHRRRWRQVQLGPLQNDTTPGVQRAMAQLLRALDREEADVVKKQRAAAQPQPHRYTLKAVPPTGSP